LLDPACSPGLRLPSFVRFVVVEEREQIGAVSHFAASFVSFPALASARFVVWFRHVIEIGKFGKPMKSSSPANALPPSRIRSCSTLEDDLVNHPTRKLTAARFRTTDLCHALESDFRRP
jgi:hypothetical protein